MKKVWQVLTAVCFSVALALPLAKSTEASGFTFTPTKPAETGSTQTVETAPKVKSIKLAVVPLMIGEKVEDNEGKKPIIYSNELAKLFQYPEYDMVDSEPVRKAALMQQDNLFTKEGMEAVAKASGADVVIALAVDKFEVNEDYMRREPMTFLNYEGRFATINLINGKYKEDNWNYGNEMESGALSPRYDWPHTEFAKAVRRELKKAVKNNK